MSVKHQELLAAKRHTRESPVALKPVIIGRSESLNVGGSVDEAIERCAAYVEAGAEVATPSMVPVEEISEVAAQIGAPCTTWGAGTHRAAELEVAGHAMAIYAGQSVLASYRGVRDLLRGLSTKGAALAEDEFMGLFGELLALQGAPGNQEIAVRFSTDT